MKVKGGMPRFKIGSELESSYGPIRVISVTDPHGTDEVADYSYEVQSIATGRLARVGGWKLVQAGNTPDNVIPEADSVNNPAHYQHPSGIEVIDITRHESFLRGNVLKYVLRAPYKGNEVEDIKKALKYLTWELERLEKQSDV